jgi:DNA adenine methylase
VFFGLSPHKATISDTNLNLVSLYQHVKDNTRELFEALQALQKEFNELPPEEKSAHYYSKRAQFNSEAKGTIRQSALMVFLNKTGFNGMYRENPKGEFNIPFAKKKTVNLPTYEHLEACKSVLDGSDVLHTGFESILDRAKSGDFVYFDPPYVPLTKTSSFTSYQAKGFSLQDHEKLGQTFSSLHDLGVKVLLSNSDTPEVRRIFRGFTVETVYARRSINSKGSGRGAVAEVLVRNY